MASLYIDYHPDVEQPIDDEQQVIADILASMQRLDQRTHDMYGKHVRVSHGKSHGVAVGELTVLDDLPAHLAQGLFAKPATYPIIARLANVPGEVVTDAVNTQRGFSFKILNVDGPMLDSHATQKTQDFVLDTGTTFGAPDAKAFFVQHRALMEYAPKIPAGIKEAVSDLSRFTNQALNAVGLNSPKLDFFGSSRIHPLAEAYYTQAAIRYGRYIAKLAVVPVSPAQKALAETDVTIDGDKDSNALRTATVDYLRAHDAEFDVRVQLCMDLTQMPVEDTSKEWDQEKSPYLTVARLRIPKQDAYSPARQQYVDSLSFSVAHCLEAHRPLGSLMRARLVAYPAMALLRRQGNHEPTSEPTSIDEVPA